MDQHTAQNMKDLLDQQAAYLKKNWGWFLVLGLLLTGCGIFAVTHLLFSSVASVFFLGVALFTGGVFMLILAIQVSGIKRLFWSYLLSGILFLLACWFILAQPTIALMSITVMTALFLGASGIMRMVAGFQAMGLPGSLWMMISGVIGVAAAVLIAADIRTWAIFLPGMLLGFDILFNGISMMIVGWTLKKASR